MDVFELLRCAILKSGHPDFIVAIIAGFIAWTLVEILKAILS